MAKVEALHLRNEHQYLDEYHKRDLLWYIWQKDSEREDKQENLNDL